MVLLFQKEHKKRRCQYSFSRRSINYGVFQILFPQNEKEMIISAALHFQKP